MKKMGGKFREGSGESWYDREKVGSGRGDGVACGGGEDAVGAGGGRGGEGRERKVAREKEVM